MGKPKPMKDKLFKAAVLKMSFRLRGVEGTPAFSVYAGVLRDLEIEDAAVEDYILAHRQVVEAAARGKAP